MSSAAAHQPITCPHYEPGAQGRRCSSYLDGGACARPDVFMCTEWLKVNPLPTPSSPPRLFDPTPQTPTAAQKLQMTLFGPPEPIGDGAPLPGPAGAAPTSFLSQADLASFKARGLALRIATPDLGELWIVPTYTAAARRELSLEHAALVAALVSAFPGARLIALEDAKEAPP